jgi:ketosteroid isomerase-like protein
MQSKKTHTPEEQAFLDQIGSVSTWNEKDVDYQQRDVDSLAGRYTDDAISTPANHSTLWGNDEIKAWYARRTGGDFDMNLEARPDSVDIVGDIAVIVGVFRVTRAPKEGVAALDHGGRYLMVMKKVDGEWKIWRDMDTPSPDADVFYGEVPRGW